MPRPRRIGDDVSGRVSDPREPEGGDRWIGRGRTRHVALDATVGGGQADGRHDFSLGSLQLMVACSVIGSNPLDTRIEARYALERSYRQAPNEAHTWG